MGARAGLKLDRDRADASLDRICGRSMTLTAPDPEAIA
jgi:hypothetical protein